MKYLQNLHQHCIFCDGKDTPEEVVLGAIEQGFDSIGFSSHSYMPWSTAYSWKMEDTGAYRAEINALKAKYKGKLDIYCGVEVEFYSPGDFSGFDFLIGSVHCLTSPDGEILPFDRDAVTVRKLIHDHFDGDGMKFAKKYYQTLQQLPDRANFDILGHFDLITKHIEKHPFFDVNSKQYRNAAMEALEHLAGKIPYFEVNTGAIARGYRTTPYPMDFFLPELRRLGYGAVITSDCHDISKLAVGYELAEDMLKKAGFDTYYILTDRGFTPVEF